MRIIDLVEKVNPKWVHLIGGEGGLNRNVDWVHMVGSVEIADFLKGNEIAFTTGVGLRENNTLMMLVESVYQNHASGMIINIGPYIQEIPQEVIDFANAKNFPIFESPWEVHLADIMRIFSVAIQESQQKSMELSALFRYAIFTSEKKELYLPSLLEKDYSLQWNYSILLISFQGNRLDDKERENVRREIENHLFNDFKNNVIFMDNARMVCILANKNEKEAGDYAQKLSKLLKKKNEDPFYMSIGPTSHGLFHLHESYTIALKLLGYIQETKKAREVYSYDSMGILRLLFQIDDVKHFKSYYQKTVMKIDVYDAMNQSNLMKTLEAYLACDGSTQKTADQLFVHRNTVLYQLKKIEGILGMDLTDLSCRMECAVGLMAKVLQNVNV